MTVKETIEMYKGEYDLVEIYVSDGLHTDSCESYEPEQGKDYKAESWALMNCEDEKILCILISRESIAMGEEYGTTAAKEKNMKQIFITTEREKEHTMTEQEQIKFIKKAYKCGISCRKTGDNPSWYTPRLTLAFNLGYSGIDIDFDKIITAKRYGALPAICSHNFLTDSSENGVSVISIDGDESKNWEEMFMGDRKLITFRGLLINAKGSDGEYLVFPLDMTEQLDY